MSSFNFTREVIYFMKYTYYLCSERYKRNWILWYQELLRNEATIFGGVVGFRLTTLTLSVFFRSWQLIVTFWYSKRNVFVRLDLAPPSCVTSGCKKTRWRRLKSQKRGSKTVVDKPTILSSGKIWQQHFVIFASQKKVTEITHVLFLQKVFLTFETDWV